MKVLLIAFMSLLFLGAYPVRSGGNKDPVIQDPNLPSTVTPIEEIQSVPSPDSHAKANQPESTIEAEEYDEEELGPEEEKRNADYPLEEDEVIP